MSRLARRVERIEGGPVEGLDIIAEGPGWMPEEQAFAEVYAIAREHGVMPPFRKCIFVIQTFGEPEEGDHVKITFVGRVGVDADLSEPLTRKKASCP